MSAAPTLSITGGVTALALMAVNQIGRVVRRVAGHGVRRLASALVEPERRVAVGHEAGVGHDAQHPAVHAHDGVEDVARIAAVGEEDAGDQDQDLRDWRLTSGGAGPRGFCLGDHKLAAGVQVRLVQPIACVSDRYLLFVLNPVACT